MKRLLRKECCEAEVGGLAQSIVGAQAVTAMHLHTVILIQDSGWFAISNGEYVLGDVASCSFAALSHAWDARRAERPGSNRRAEANAAIQRGWTSMDMNISVSDLVGVLRSIRGSGRKILSQPLGFYRILITARDGTSPGFMLHAWLDRDQPKQSKNAPRDIHSHTFDLRSRVLVGELQNELFNVIEDADGDHRIARIRQEGPKATRVITATTVRVVVDSKEIVSAGEIYGFPSRRFHCTVIRSYPTITLMQKERMISDEAANLVRREHTDQELGTYVQPELEQELLWDRILSVLES